MSIWFRVPPAAWDQAKQLEWEAGAQLFLTTLGKLAGLVVLIIIVDTLWTWYTARRR